jgi:hypothetical protein
MLMKTMQQETQEEWDAVAKTVPASMEMSPQEMPLHLFKVFKNLIAK